MMLSSDRDAYLHMSIGCVVLAQEISSACLSAVIIEQLVSATYNYTSCVILCSYHCVQTSAYLKWSLILSFNKCFQLCVCATDTVVMCQLVQTHIQHSLLIIEVAWMLWLISIGNLQFIWYLILITSALLCDQTWESMHMKWIGPDDASFLHLWEFIFKEQPNMGIYFWRE